LDVKQDRDLRDQRRDDLESDEEVIIYCEIFDRKLSSSEEI
jgi:hypothetical protein